MLEYGGQDLKPVSEHGEPAHYSYAAFIYQVDHIPVQQEIQAPARLVIATQC